MLLAAQAAGTDQAPTYVVGTQYLMKGYSLLYGNPLPEDSGLDPGFSRYGGGDIFEMSFDAGATTDDNLFLAPDYVQMRVLRGCTYQFQARIASDAEKYLTQLRELLALEAEDRAGPLFRRAFRYAENLYQLRSRIEKQREVPRPLPRPLLLHGCTRAPLSSPPQVLATTTAECRGASC